MAGLNEAAFNAFVPALVYRTAANSELPSSTVAGIASAALLVSAGTGLLSWLWFRGRPFPSRGLTLAAMIPNNANMGMSLCGLAFGAEGLALATAYYATTAFMTFTVGLYVMTGGSNGLREIFKVPILYALGCGVVVHEAGLVLPQAIDRGIEIMGQAAIPLMLFSLGHRLARTRLGSLRLAGEATVIRIGCGLGLGLLSQALLPLSPTAKHVVVLQAMMPTAVITTVMAERYKREPELVASTVAVSTLASVALLPLLLSRML